MKLLRLDSSARRDSVSRQLTAEFVRLWQAAHPDGQLLERDLAAAPFSIINDDWLAAMRAESSQHTAPQRGAISPSDLYIGELISADLIVIGAPMHNFNISWPLKAWIDQIVRLGKTVIYTEKGPKGLLQNKKVIVISSRGGSYQPGTPRAHLDFLEPYLRAIFAFIGLTDVAFIHADNQFRPDEAALGKAAASQQIAQLFEHSASLRPTELAV